MKLESSSWFIRISMLQSEDCSYSTVMCWWLTNTKLDFSRRMIRRLARFSHRNIQVPVDTSPRRASS
jgi:hypothetical protein